MFNYNPNDDGLEAKDLFDKLYKNISFDKKLLKQLRVFRLNWVGKGTEYSEFLGGNTLGLHAIRFSSRDDSYLLTDIYNVDQDILLTNIRKLPDIDANWAVSTNPILQTLCYTMHRFIVDGLLGNKLEDGLKECYYIFVYKVLGSLLSNYFKHNTTPAIAKATYERLSNRFLIKKYGTWNNVFEYRARTVFPKTGAQRNRLVSYSTKDSIRIVNDLQGSIRDTIKYIWVVMEDVIENNTKIRTTTLIDNNDGEESTKSVTDRPDKYILRLKEYMGNPINLIDEDIIHLITNFIKSSDSIIIKDTLLDLANNHDPRNNNDKYIDNIILRTIWFCGTKGIVTDYRGNIISIIKHMKGYWSSGSVKNKEVLGVKSIVSKSVRNVTKRTTKWVIAANTLATIVYLFVRAIK